MKEIVFHIVETPEGGFTARALGFSIFTDADETMDELRANVRDAIRCHFHEEDLPRVARLYFVKDEIIVI